MRRFVDALFACCAPRRTASTDSFGEGGIPLDHDLDEGSCVSSTSDGTIDPREMFGGSEKSSGSVCSELELHTECSPPQDCCSKPGAHTQSVSHTSESVRSLDVDAAVSLSDSASAKSADHDGHCLESGSEHGSKGVTSETSCEVYDEVTNLSVVEMDGVSSHGAGDVEIRSGSEDDTFSIDQAKSGDVVVNEDVKLQETSNQDQDYKISHNQEPCQASDDDKTFSADYSFLENDVSLTLSAEQPSVNLSTDSEAVKRLISDNTETLPSPTTEILPFPTIEIPSSPTTELSENILLHNGANHLSSPVPSIEEEPIVPTEEDGESEEEEEQLEIEKDHPEIVPAVRLSRCLSSGSSDSSDTDLEDEFLFSAALPLEVGALHYSLYGIITSKVLTTYRTWFNLFGSTEITLRAYIYYITIWQQTSADLYFDSSASKMEYGHYCLFN